MIDLCHNQMLRQVLRSLANCTMLQALLLDNNQIKGPFPYWFPELQILVLWSNRFHGAIENPKGNLLFLKLRIVDLSNNGFSSNLPSDYFETWNAMKMVKPKKLTYMEVNASSNQPQYYSAGFRVFNDNISQRHTAVILGDPQCLCSYRSIKQPFQRGNSKINWKSQWASGVK